MTTIFNETTMTECEWGTHRDIEAIRNADGSVDIVIGTWTERDDKTAKTYHLSLKAAESFGRVLLCMRDNDFSGLIGRAQVVKKGEDE